MKIHSKKTERKGREKLKEKYLKKQNREIPTAENNAAKIETRRNSDTVSAKYNIK